MMQAGDRPAGRFLMQVLWPAFLVAVIAEGLFFSMVDPQHLELLGFSIADDRRSAYTIGFFLFWVLFSLSSGLTWLLSRGIDRPLPAAPGVDAPGNPTGTARR
jgi:hypothetical protein